MQQTGSSFRLTKWYLDCVDSNGDVAIVYSAEVSWGGADLHYASVLHNSAGTVRTRNTIRHALLSHEAEKVVSFQSQNLGLTGVWKQDAEPLRQRIFESSLGCVEWNCVQPRSRVKVEFNDTEMQGSGYAERLTLTIPPWKLPMRELRWGRFISAEQSLIWIDWQGPFSARHIFWNGKPVVADHISDSELILKDCTLQLDRGLVLRSGRLLETVLPGAALLGKIFPASLFESEEQKWRSRGILTIHGKRVEGWAIHEVVRWNT